jgi:hypothetical protein
MTVITEFSNSRYGMLPEVERLRAALEDVRALLAEHDDLDPDQTTDLQDIVNQGLCTGRDGCDWCIR